MSTPTPGRAFTRAPLPDALVSLLTLAFLAVVIRTAWLSDDALITLRTVLNVTHGFGLRFNIDERVQTFTHPLWLGVLTIAYYLTWNVYFAAFASAVLTSVLAFWLAVTRAASAWQGAAVVVILLFSRAFVDFSTSGLENPLSYVLLAWFVFTYTRLDRLASGDGPPPSPHPASGAPATSVKPPSDPGQTGVRPGSDRGQTGVRPGSDPSAGLLTRLWLIASLLYLTRPDDIVIALPLLTMATWRWRRRRAVRSILIGLMPAIAWTMFAVVYYGFPFPNTAYAKLTMGIDPAELRMQGLLYLIDSVDRDPLTLTTVGFAVLLAIKQRRAPALGLAAGLVLYLAYVVSIGGDFMAGRFVAVPLFGAALLIGTFIEGERSFWIAATVLFAALGSAGSHLPLWSNSSFGDSANKLSGIIDERGVYFHDKSLVLARRSTFREPDWPKAKPGDHTYQVMPTCGLMGTAGVDLGPYTHLLDECALADPLLAHLPAIFSPEWRTGHYRRMIPTGYQETLEHGENVIKDRGLHDFYGHLAAVVRSQRVWSWARLKEIAALASGKYDRLIDRTFYRYGGSIATPNALANMRPDGTPWNDPLNHVLTGPVAVVYSDAPRARRIDISLDSDDKYFLTFFKQGRIQSTMELGPIPEYRRGPGLMHHSLDIPPRAASGGFDVLLITPAAGDGHYAVGHVVVQ